MTLCDRRYVRVQELTVTDLVRISSHLFLSESAGCADGSREALQGFERVAACGGQWVGHIVNATALCGQGWRVCGWYDHALLSNITWSQATAFPGCYAFNAAQDGGRCQECRDDLEQVSFFLSFLLLLLLLLLLVKVI